MDKATGLRKGSRVGTRVACEISIIISSSDPDNPFSEQCRVVLVNLNGCAALLRRPLKIGAPLRLEGLPVTGVFTGKVVTCVSLGKHENLWLIGLALDESGNVWGIPEPPEDWQQSGV